MPAPTAGSPDPAKLFTKTWREIFPVHPCADIYPMLADEDLVKLAQDIDTHGLRQPVVLWCADDDATGERISVLDGRNRLEALAILGATFIRPAETPSFPTAAANTSSECITATPPRS